MFQRLTVMKGTRPRQFRSRSTGKLQIRVLAQSLDAYDGGISLDGGAATDALNQHYIDNVIDAECVSVKHIGTGGLVDYVETVNWVAAEPSLDGSFPIDPATMSLVIKALAVAFATLVIGGTIVTVLPAIRELYDPKNFYASDGTGPYTRSQAATMNRALNPDMWVDPTTTFVLDPNDPNFEAEKTFIIENTPEGWGGAFPWQDVTTLLLVIAGIAVVVIVVPPIVTAFTRRLPTSPR